MTQETINMFETFHFLVWGDIRTVEEQKRWFDIQLLESEESAAEFNQHLLDSDFLEWLIADYFKTMNSSEVIEELRKEKDLFKFFGLTEKANEIFIKCKKLKGQ